MRASVYAPWARARLNARQLCWRAGEGTKKNQCYKRLERGRFVLPRLALLTYLDLQLILEGIDLPVCRMANVTANWLAPLAEAIKNSILQERVIHVDETVLPLSHPVKTINARAWAYVGAASKLVYDEFTTNKKGEHVRNVLEQWNPPDGKRYLQADAASNYDELYRCQAVLVCACREQAN